MQAGWCIFNDQAVAARSVQRDMGVERILFVDLDVHQARAGRETVCIYRGMTRQGRTTWRVVAGEAWPACLPAARPVGHDA